MTASQLAVAVFAPTQIPKRRHGTRRYRTATGSAQALGTGVGRQATARSSAGRSGALVLACLSLFALAGLFTAASAMGGQTHPFQSEFTGSDTPAGSLSTADKLAVRQSTGDVYVIDKSHGVVDTFDGSGSYLSQVGLIRVRRRSRPRGRQLRHRLRGQPLRAPGVRPAVRVRPVGNAALPARRLDHPDRRLRRRVRHRGRLRRERLRRRLQQPADPKIRLVGDLSHDHRPLLHPVRHGRRSRWHALRDPVEHGAPQAAAGRDGPGHHRRRQPQGGERRPHQPSRLRQPRHVGHRVRCLREHREPVRRRSGRGQPRRGRQRRERAGLRDLQPLRRWPGAHLRAARSGPRCHHRQRDERDGYERHAQRPRRSGRRRGHHRLPLRVRHRHLLRQPRSRACRRHRSRARPTSRPTSAA